LLLQKFNCEIRDKKGSENLVVDHLSRTIYGRELETHISECFPSEQLFTVHSDPWYAVIVNYLISSRVHDGWTKNDRDIFFHLVKFFV